VIIGAGPTGVELTGQAAELAHRVLTRDYRAIDSRSATILLLDAAPAVCPFAPKLQGSTRAGLGQVGPEGFARQAYRAVAHVLRSTSAYAAL
jgi:NADH:ubiquinone reductase (H+-translocating)